MEPTTLLEALPNLGVGVASIVALVLVTTRFLSKLDDREHAMRELEREVRNSIMQQLNKNSIIMGKLLDRYNLTNPDDMSG